MRRHPPRVDLATDVMASGQYRIWAMVEGVRTVAHTMELRWGVGRLRLLVSDLLRAKFDEQSDRLDAALATEQEHVVRIHADGMRRAWTALERAALDAGEQPLSPLVWECVLPETGEVISLVRTDAEAQHVARAGRVFTIGEIAVLIAGVGDCVLDVKQQFPGATVTGIRRKPPIDWERGDELPALEDSDAQHS